MKPDLNMPRATEFTGRLVSYSLPCPDVTLLDFLRHAEGQERFYWENANDEVAFAGYGAAAALTAWGPGRFESIRQQAAALFDGAALLAEAPPQIVPRLFGGFSFTDDFVPDNTWAIYAPAYFVLPHYQLTRVINETWLTLNAQIPFEDDPRDLQEAMHTALQAKIAELQALSLPPIPENPPEQISYPMPYDTWAQIIRAAQQRMAAGDLNKVVLARVCEVRFKDRVNLVAPLIYLAQHYAGCYRFLFEPRPHYGFYGATPELIAQVEGRRFRSMGLAGSIRRGQTPEEDTALACELLNSKKDRYEHQLVVDRMQERLQPITHDLNIGQTDVYVLSNIQHLHTPISATLKSDDGVLPVVAALHPTPALGGDPRALAMQMIQESEPVPRGWYAAPVGWIDSRLDGQFSVAIRSAVAQERRVWTYAGAGIVSDSIPQKEWDETALKFRPMLNALKACAEC